MHHNVHWRPNMNSLRWWEPIVAWWRNVLWANGVTIGSEWLELCCGYALTTLPLPISVAPVHWDYSTVADMPVKWPRRIVCAILRTTNNCDINSTPAKQPIYIFYGIYCSPSLLFTTIEHLPSGTVDTVNTEQMASGNHHFTKNTRSCVICFKGGLASQISLPGYSIYKVLHLSQVQLSVFQSIRSNVCTWLQFCQNNFMKFRIKHSYLIAYKCFKWYVIWLVPITFSWFKYFMWEDVDLICTGKIAMQIALCNCYSVYAISVNINDASAE